MVICIAITVCDLHQKYLYIKIGGVNDEKECVVYSDVITTKTLTEFSGYQSAILNLISRVLAYPFTPATFTRRQRTA